MSAPTAPTPSTLAEALSHELLRLAQREDDLAVLEAEQVHYWEPMPVTVSIHRQCAAALRAAADEFSRPSNES